MSLHGDRGTPGLSLGAVHHQPLKQGGFEILNPDTSLTPQTGAIEGDVCVAPQDEILRGQKPVGKRRKQQQKPEKWSGTNSKLRASKRMQSDGAATMLGTMSGLRRREEQTICRAGRRSV